MNFNDHSYGGTPLSVPSTVIEIMKQFLREVCSTVESGGGAEDIVQFSQSLEALIHSLQGSLYKMQSANQNTSISPPISCQATPTSSQTSTVSEIESDTKMNVKRELDADLVQVRADNSEIQRRIAAFMEKKQKEVDDINIREFSSSFGSEAVEDSCARTDSLYIPRTGATSHIKVSRVVNKYGPQTQRLHESAEWQQMQNGQTTSSSAKSADMEERLHNMETHLHIDRGSRTSKMEVFERIKKLEDRILTLESMSPEYMNVLVPPKKKSRRDDDDRQSPLLNQEMTLSEINERIVALRQKLQHSASGIT